MRLGFTVFFKEKPPKGNYSKPSEATNKFNTINMKKVCYPHGQTCASRRYFVFHTHTQNAMKSMIPVITFILIVVLFLIRSLENLIYSPEFHAIIPDDSEYRQKSDVADP